MPTLHAAHESMFGLARHAERYEQVAGRLAAPLYRRVTSDVVAAALPPGSTILDIGTGPGLVPVRIAASCPDLRIMAVDLAAEMIDRARHAAQERGLTDRVTFVEGDVARLPYPDDSVDLVVSTLSQHHWADPAAGLRDVCRVLRPGGQAWIYDLRWALRRAQAASRSISPAPVVERQSPLIGASWFTPIGRLVLRVTSPAPPR